MEDRRISKTKTAIQRSFFMLLREKPLNRITVAEICRMANIGRGTFYLHYLDVYDLYDKIEDDLYAGLYALFEDAFPSTNHENSKKLTEGLTSYIEQRREHFLLLIRSGSSHSLQKLKHAFNEKVLAENRLIHPDENLQYDAMEAIFVVSGMIGVMEEWLASGMTLPRTEVAAMLDRILCKINV